MQNNELNQNLIARGQAGDRDALASIVDRLQAPLYNLALRLLLTREDAEDATQEALLKILDRLHLFRGESKFTTWAWTVASRAFLDIRKGRYRSPMMSFDEFRADLADGLDVDAVEHPEAQVLIGQVKLGCTRALLQCLDGDHRLAFVLGEILELPSMEAAEIAGVSDAAFRKRLSRSRERVYTALQAHCGLVNPSLPCRCHRRLRRATELGRVSPDGPDLHVDTAHVRVMLETIEDIYAKGAAYFRIDPEEPPAPTLKERALQLFASA